VKKYPLFRRRRDRAMAFLGATRRLPSRTALEGINFTVEAGEAVGLVGENGSGKSSLLRVLAGISQPDGGEVWVERPVAGILELGLGFHPDFTGRENALLYGALLGLDDDEIRRRLPAILTFADLGEFADQALRTYSSGMAARLAFAVASEVEPRVLLVDEALAVGDGAFQKKCVDRMVRFRDSGRTVVFCSHAMYLVTGFCRRAVWLHNGRIERDGPAPEVVQAYESYLMSREKRSLADGGDGGGAAAGAMARIVGVRIVDARGADTTAVAPREACSIAVTFDVEDPSTACHVGVAVDAPDGRCVFGAMTAWDGVAPTSGTRRRVVRLDVASLPLAPGRFTVSAFLLDETGLLPLDKVLASDRLEVTGRSWTPSLVEAERAWVVES
jgi:lipopolysaccharide transport system ATP-binding protein